MKKIVRMGVFSALLFASSLPAFSAPSDSDMGFAGGREPTAADVGYQAVMTRGYRDDSGSSGATAQAAQGQVGRTSQKNSDTLWFDQNRDTSQYLPSTILPYRASSTSQSQTRQNSYQQLTQQDTGWMPLARNSVSGISTAGPQNLGFKDGPLGFGTFYSLTRGLTLPKTGTGSVNASICSPDGKQ